MKMALWELCFRYVCFTATYVRSTFIILKRIKHHNLNEIGRIGRNSFDTSSAAAFRVLSSSRKEITWLWKLCYPPTVCKNEKPLWQMMLTVEIKESGAIDGDAVISVCEVSPSAASVRQSGYCPLLLLVAKTKKAQEKQVDNVNKCQEQEIQGVTGHDTIVSCNQKC